jgi:phosphatidate phosphatase APP1
MAGWAAFLARVSSDVERRLDKVNHWREHFDTDPLVIFSYLTYGTMHTLWLKGRVLEAYDIKPASKTDSPWRNARNTFKRFSSDEISGATLKAIFRGQSWQLTTDEEGFFEHWLELSTPCEPKLHSVQLELLSPLRPEQTQVHFTASVMVPSVSSSFGIISDIDDTILKSDATRKRKAAQKIIFGNAFSREAFDGVAAFYQTLHQDVNPVFYVSSSPWNVYDVLLQFLELNTIPMGPLLLRDWGLSADEILPSNHVKHKLSTIRQILQTYPDLPFLLMGDSGQEDPEIYKQIVKDYPSRILGIYIRDVPGAERKQDLETIAKAVSEQGVFMKVTSDSLEMMDDAKARGFILRDIRKIQI